MRRKRLIVLGVVLAVLAAGVALFPVLVRSKLRAAAARYGAEVEAEWVLPGWGGVSLRNVTASHPDAPGIRASFREVVVGWGSPREVAAEGGKVELQGALEDLHVQVERVRDRMPSGGGGGGAGTKLTLSAFDVTYRGPDGSGEARGVTLERPDGRWVLKAEGVSAEGALGSVVVAEPHVEVERGAESARLLVLKTRAIDLKAKISSAAELGAAASVGASGSRLVRARQLLDGLSRELEERVAADAQVELSGVSALIERGEERLSLGPATMRLSKRDGRFVLEYVAGALGGSAETESLIVRAPLPVASDPLRVEVRGGPISLSALGVKEGDFKLQEVERALLRANATIEVDAQGEVLSFDGDGRVEGLSAHVPALSREPLRGLKASFRGGVRAALDGSKVSVKAGELELGNVRLLTSFDASYSPPKDAKARPHLTVAGTFEVPLSPCQALLDAAPQGLLPTLTGMRLAGSISLKGHAKIDTEKLDKDFQLSWDLGSTCRVTDVPPSIDVAQFRRSFKQRVYTPAGERASDVETGPGTPGWAGYGAISRYMTVGVVSFEDARFHHHEGFDQEAIRNSIRENLRRWQFVRGASTLSMQLAKNLYLARDKVLGRKLEEAFLTMYLEQALTKEQILELYLNIVEFGPNVYGVSDAAQHYFRSSASGLSISQAFYLASILPSPKKEHFGPGGSLSQGWLKLLRTVMKHAHKRNRISDEELAAGLAEIPVRGSTSPMKDPNAEQVPEAPLDDAERELPLSP